MTEIQIVLSKIIEFLYFHKHHSTADVVVFRAEFLLFDNQNLATETKLVPIFIWNSDLTKDQIALATTHSKKRWSAVSF